MTPAELLNLATKLQEAVNMLVATVPNEPEPEPDPEPAVPAWPTAPLVWHDGRVWGRDRDGEYHRADGGDEWRVRHMEDGYVYSSGIRDEAHRFAREAISVTPVPTEAWETFAPLARGSVTSGSFTLEAARALVRAADGLEVAR